jgi:hypothetical protein
MVDDPKKVNWGLWPQTAAGSVQGAEPQNDTVDDPTKVNWGLWPRTAAGSAHGADEAKQVDWSLWPLPRVHCYCFSKTSTEEAAVADIKHRLESTMGGALGRGSGLRIRIVRDVAPGKLMMLASFTLPAEIALFNDKAGVSTQSTAKKARRG